MSLSKLTPIIFNIELTHLGLEVFNSEKLINIQKYSQLFIKIHKYFINSL